MFFGRMTTPKVCIKIELCRREWVSVLLLVIFDDSGMIWIPNDQLDCFQQILRKLYAIFLQKNARAKMNTDSLLLEAVKVHISRILIFLQTKNAQTRTDFKCGKSNASKKRQCHFLQTQTMHNNFFDRKALAPIFWKKSIEKIVVNRLRL